MAMNQAVDAAKSMVSKVAKSLKQKSVTDLIRMVRAAKPGLESTVITQALSEIKVELKDPDRAVKTIAVSKLIYLQMNGYDISWAAFNIVEVRVQKATKRRRKISKIRKNSIFS
jgi:hypothetical protein